MRCRLTPDDKKLVICTTGGYLIIIHDLDLTTLAKDLCGFRVSYFYYAGNMVLALFKIFSLF
jgi:DDB1- and CUL4-associated factor 10